MYGNLIVFIILYCDASSAMDQKTPPSTWMENVLPYLFEQSVQPPLFEILSRAAAWLKEARPTSKMFSTHFPPKSTMCFIFREIMRISRKMHCGFYSEIE